MYTPQAPAGSERFTLPLYGVVILLVIISGAYGQYRLRKGPAISRNQAILLGYYTKSQTVAQVGTGTVADLPYTMLASAVEGALIVRVELDFSSKLHLLSVPKTAGVVQIDPATIGSVMERGDLEGNYNDYFNLYCDRGEQEQARYIFDPSAMAFTVDSGRSYSWEIMDTDLYFVQAGANLSGNMMASMAPFIQQIRPALGIPLTDEQKRLSTPYGAERRKSLPCPICQTDMPWDDTCFTCPTHHGYLMNSLVLMRVHRGELKLAASDGQPVQADRSLTCPACGTAMDAMAYNGGPAKIDTCPNCHYHWLDPGDLAGVAAHGQAA